MTSASARVAAVFQPLMRLTDRISFATIAIGGLLLVILGFTILFFLPRDRSFVVETETFGVEITFRQSAMNAWRIVNPIVCARRETRLSAGTAGTFDDICSERLYEVARPNFAELTWPPGTKVAVTRDGSDGRLELLVRETGASEPVIEGKALRAGSRIVLDSADWGKTGMLVFSGTAVAGSVPGPGVRDYVAGGRYEVWETLPLRPGTARIASGTLFAGDRASITNAHGDAGMDVSGFLSPHDKNAAGEGFRLLVYSPLGDTRLRIDRLNTERALVAGNWYQRVSADPWVIGISAIVGFAALLIEFFRKVSALRPSK